jgi:hypothetical protein
MTPARGQSRNGQDRWRLFASVEDSIQAGMDGLARKRSLPLFG